jgi:hypothetical protein
MSVYSTRWAAAAAVLPPSVLFSAAIAVADCGLRTVCLSVIGGVLLLLIPLRNPRLCAFQRARVHSGAVRLLVSNRRLKGRKEESGFGLAQTLNQWRPKKSAPAL